MGNTSRDTFNDLKQYVGVRLQQGVPLVDADWNELEDIRRFELRAYLKWFVGDGIPFGNNGFAIRAIPAVNNDFRIVGGDGSAQGAGRCLVDGLDVFIDANLDYSNQLLVDTTKATAMGVPPVNLLTTPVADIEYLVYLDVWEREVFPGEPTDDQDIFDRNLINEEIGVPTCTRLKREWVVRIADASLPAPVAASGHFHYQLARLARRNGDASVNPEDITDLRRTGLRLQSQNDIDQITQDTFGLGYTLNGDGQGDLKISIRETINTLLRGEVPITAPEAVTFDASSNVFPKSLIDQSGNTWLFWLSDRAGGGLDVWYNRFDTRLQSWDGETQISFVASVSVSINMLEDTAGNIWVFWDSTTSGNRDIWYDRYIAASSTWEGNTQLSTSTTSDDYQNTIIDQSGDIWVFWESSEGGNDNIWYNRYVVGTASWDGAVQITTDPGTDRRPSVVIDRNNDIWLFWYSNRGGNENIWFRRYTAATATWGSDTQRTFDAGADRYPKAVIDNLGRIWLFWRSNRSGHYELWYQQNINGNWGSEVQLTTSPNSVDDYYDLRVDSKGDVWVAWTFSDGIRQDIWYTRNSNGSWDKSRNLTSEVLDAFNYLPSIEALPDGDIQILWSSIDSATFTAKSWYRNILTSI